MSTTMTSMSKKKEKEKGQANWAILAGQLSVGG
jgi:hypothetical protein